MRKKIFWKNEKREKMNNIHRKREKFKNISFINLGNVRIHISTMEKLKKER